ncbi:MAG: TetR/AcrR family transcriptional regulator [Hyphomicrobiales bacterium]|nr:TetR/AcrR family transcriptional regulator [Hyphomicrobiales bacterium]
MPGRSSQRDKIVRATADLLRRRGYAATGLAEVIETSRAPKGSLYHYFPGGKEELATAAIAYAAERVRITLSELAATQQTPAAILRAYGVLVAGWLAQSGFRDGCPITTTALETAPEKADLTKAARDAFAGWCGIFEERLIASGLGPERARRLSRLAIMALEGALIVARVEQSGEPILSATADVAAMIESESAR